MAAQEALEPSAQDLYDHAPCGYLSTSPDGTIVRVNETFLRWTGYARGDLEHRRRFQELLSVGGRIYHETHVAPLLRMQGHVREIAVELVRADGARMPALVNSVLVAAPDGTPHVVRTTVIDATERARYEHELLAARDRERAARGLVEALQRLTAAVGAAADARAVAAAVREELTAAFDAPAGLSDAKGVPAEASIALPAGGAILWVALPGRRAPEPDERAFLAACAEQAGLALERARLFEQQRDVAHTLQQSLLSDPLPADPRYELATAYRPAIEHLEVGGDWHDAFELPGDRLGIVVGDVVGRGLGAATAMGQLRSAVRALAVAGFGPAAVLDHLDAFTGQLPAARYATLIYAEVEAATGKVCCASAGHLPALLLPPDGEPEYLMRARSTPLAVPPDDVREQSELTLAHGGGFLFYTDGLVERRGESIDDGLARLAAAVRGRTFARLAAELPDALAEPGAGDDDVCLLAFRRT